MPALNIFCFDLLRQHIVIHLTSAGRTTITPPPPLRYAVLVLVVIMYRRRHVRTLYKEPVDEMRDTIINYDDEGGGEKDQTGYDLSVLQVQATGLSPPSE